MTPGPESGRPRPRALRRRLATASTAALLCVGGLIALPGQAAAQASAQTPARTSAADPVIGQLAYASVFGVYGASNALAVMDAGTGSIVDYKTLPQVLAAVAVNPAGTELYGATQGAVVVIDPATDATLDTIGVGGANAAVAFNPSGTRAYVADQDGTGSVDVIDTGTRTVTAAIPVGGEKLATSPTRPLLYAIGNGTVSVIDTDTNTVVAGVACGGTIGSSAVAVDAAGTRVYALHGQDLCVIDADTNSVITTITLPTAQYSNPWDVTVNAAGTLAAVVSKGPSALIYLIDLRTDTISSSFYDNFSAAGIMNAAGTRLYITNNSSVMQGRGGVGVVDTANDHFIGGFGFPAWGVDITLGPVAPGTTTSLTVSPSQTVTQGTSATLTATVSGATSGTVQFYQRGETAAGPVPLGAPVPVINGVASFSTTALSPGKGTLSAAFTPAQPGLLRSASTPLPVDVVPPGVYIDQSISQSGTGTITTAPLSTPGSRLLLAFTSSDGPAAKQTTTVTGAGLNWTLVRRANRQRGTAEIWAALAPDSLTGATITSTPRIAGYDQQLTVVAFTGAAGVGQSAAAGRSSGSESVSLTTTAPGSQVLGVGEDYNGAVARSAGPGQYVLSQWVDAAVGNTFWTQTTLGPTPAAGTKVTLNDTATTGDIWNMAAAEVLASAP